MRSADDIWLAPLRGVTIRAFREVFGDVLRENGFRGAFAPFIPANPGIRVTDRLVDEVPFSPDLVPQVISRHPDAMRVLLRAFKNMGFKCADLNAGCPFPMIVKRGRGSGLYRTPALLGELLKVGVEEMGEGNFSLKIRLGISDPREILSIMPIVNGYPLRVLTIHARTARQMYAGIPNLDAFADAAALSVNNVMYNGDIELEGEGEFSLDALSARFPAVKSWMVGRSFVRNLGKRDDSAERLHRYLDVSCRELCGDNAVLGRMKELLSYWILVSPRWKRLWPIVKICRSVDEFRSSLFI